MISGMIYNHTEINKCIATFKHQSIYDLVDDGKQIKCIESWFFKRVVVVAENCDLGEQI